MLRDKILRIDLIRSGTGLYGYIMALLYREVEGRLLILSWWAIMRPPFLGAVKDLRIL